METMGLILFGLFLMTLVILDGSMILSLLKTGDERRQLIVWKASASTLGGVAGYLVLRVALNFVRGYEALNPYTLLTVMAAMYFVFLLYHRSRHGG